MAVSGSLRDIDLTSLISINCNEGNRAHLQLTHEGHEGSIYFDGGQIVHLTLDDREGEGVIRELLSWEEGAFSLEMDVPPPARTVHTPWSNLILEGMRVLDETTSIWGEAFQETDEEDVDVQSETVQTKEVDKMSQLKDLLKEMAAEIPGFISADVAGMDGLSIAHYSTDQNFDAEAAVSQFALVMKLVQKTSGQLKAGEVEDNLVTTKDGYILSRFLGDGSYYMAIAVDRDNSSLGNVRLMTRNFAPELWNAIPRRG